MRRGGFSLLEMLLVVALSALLLSQVWSAYQQPVERLRATEARVALLENAEFLEQWYQQHGRYQDGVRWPSLPVTETAHYHLDFESLADGHPPNKYRLYARARDDDDTYLVLDENGVIRRCAKREGRLTCERS